MHNSMFALARIGLLIGLHQNFILRRQNFSEFFALETHAHFNVSPFTEHITWTRFLCPSNILFTYIALS